MCPPMLEEMIRTAGLVNDSVTDGPGLRFTLFVQGCPRSCPGCHNPETQAASGGTLMTGEEVFAQVQANPLLGGVTLSGGEPFSQAAALVPLARRIKGLGLELAAYSGYTFEELSAHPGSQEYQLLELVDVLVDGPFVLERMNLELPFRGSENQRILNVAASLAAGRAVEEESQGWKGGAV